MMREQTSMTGTLTKRSMKKSKGRNLVAVLAVVMTTMMFTTLFTLAQSMGKNLTQMYLHQSGTSAHATCKDVTDEQYEQIAEHPDVTESGKSIVVGLAENPDLAGRRWRSGMGMIYTRGRISLILRRGRCRSVKMRSRWIP